MTTPDICLTVAVAALFVGLLLVWAEASAAKQNASASDRTLDRLCDEIDGGWGPDGREIPGLSQRVFDIESALIVARELEPTAKTQIAELRKAVAELAQAPATTACIAELERKVDRMQAAMEGVRAGLMEASGHAAEGIDCDAPTETNIEFTPETEKAGFEAEDFAELREEMRGPVPCAYGACE